MDKQQMRLQMRGPVQDRDSQAFPDNVHVPEETLDIKGSARCYIKEDGYVTAIGASPEEVWLSEREAKWVMVQLLKKFGRVPK